MRKVARPRIVTKERLDTAGLPEHVLVSLAEIAGAAQEGVLALSVACGLQVVSEMLAADVARICGPEGQARRRPGGLPPRDRDQAAALGGALVKTDRPRTRGPAAGRWRPVGEAHTLGTREGPRSALFGTAIDPRAAPPIPKCALACMGDERGIARRLPAGRTSAPRTGSSTAGSHGRAAAASQRS